MASEMSAGHAPAGDVTAAILEVDSTLKRINGTSTCSPADLSEALVSSPAEAADLLDGFCTLMYLFMAAMMTAAAMGLGPGLWRAAYGPWRREELMALERTLLILAQEINAAYGTDNAALRMVMDVLAAADDDSTL